MTKILFLYCFIRADAKMACAWRLHSNSTIAANQFNMAVAWNENEDIRMNENIRHFLIGVTENDNFHSKIFLSFCRSFRVFDSFFFLLCEKKSGRAMEYQNRKQWSEKSGNRVVAMWSPATPNFRIYSWWFRVVYVLASFRSPFEYKISVKIISGHSIYWMEIACYCFEMNISFGFVLAFDFNFQCVF